MFVIEKKLKNDNSFLVKYKNSKYDLTEFLHKHPGGINTLGGYQNKDVTDKMHGIPPHSDSALYLLNEYKVDEDRIVEELSNERINNKNSNGNCNGIKINYNGESNGSVVINEHSQRDGIELDGSMEYLVDWSKPMLAQIGHLGDKYTDWSNKPVDRPLRLFESDWLEAITKTPWWFVPLFWLPSISAIIYTGISQAYEKNFDSVENTSGLFINFVAGIILWTLLEYTLHRWIFHIETKNSSTVLCTAHFLFHGLHHKVPFDPYRLVFPPVPAIILASIIYFPLSNLFTCSRLILAGGLTGYLIYDLTHYYIHYGSPTGGHLYRMKRYHYQHHFVHHDQGFGISSSIWDDIFGTTIYLRKLNYLLKWR